jgi:hypothetical protein
MTLRVDPKIKAAAEAAARRDHRSITSLIEVLILNPARLCRLRAADSVVAQHPQQLRLHALGFRISSVLGLFPRISRHKEF